jgi:hypothetical protein
MLAVGNIAKTLKLTHKVHRRAGRRMRVVRLGL